VAVADALAAGFVLGLVLVQLVAHRLAASPARQPGRGLLVLDAAYSLDGVRRRGQEHSLISRDLDGWFARVWHVHPLVGADDRESSSVVVGPPLEVALAAGHVWLEGHPSLRAGTRLPLTSFAVAQLLLVNRLHAVLRTGAVSAIRAGDPYYLGLMGLGLARAHRLPLVLRINGNYDQIYEAVGRLAYPRLFKRRWVEKRVDRFVLRRADLVAGANRDNLGFALRNGTPAARGTVFPYGALIDPVHRSERSERRDVRDELGLVGRTLLAGVTRLEPVKHTADLLHVLHRLHSDHPDVALLVVGEGSQLPDLQRLAAELGLAESVVFAGSRDQRWIADALGTADVYVAPSAGRALVEAALAALPIVAYDVDWHAELVVDGVSGFLVGFRDVPGLAAALDRLLRNPELARRLGHGARSLAAETMDPGELVALEREAFGRLLSTAGGTS
jgi:glycosyltransferase involved in cell wall biosynthesis